jgi:hypothetical protein
MDYSSFVGAKAPAIIKAGFAPDIQGDHLWEWQRDCVDWACQLGRGALLEDTGLGKTRQQIEWARQVANHTGRRVLILAPLAVGAQTVREGQAIGVEGIAQSRTPDDISTPIVVTNYERAHIYNPADFVGVVLDESSILKSFMGKTKRMLLESFGATPYRLSCTATPAPNDHLELGNQAEFLGVMSSHQMIARWFINDAKTMGDYRLKGHAVESYWDWVSSWARCVGRPSDLGNYSDDGYVLPSLDMRQVTVQVDLLTGRGESLFRQADLSATGLHQERRRTAAARADATAEIVLGEADEPWCIWVETNYDADEVMKRIPGAVEVAGSMTPDEKADRLLAFSDGSIRVLVTKPKIAGFGMNWQHCARTVFNGPSYSYEMLYQALRRFWRFGQLRPVEAHIVMASTEQSVWSILMDKADGHEAMKAEMFAASRRAQGRSKSPDPYFPTHDARLPAWLSY